MSATLAVQEGVQVHGGMSMTDQFDIGFFMKRVRLCQELFDDDNFHADALARMKSIEVSVIASAAKQSRGHKERLDCLVAGAPRNEEERFLIDSYARKPQFSSANSGCFAPSSLALKNIPLYAKAKSATSQRHPVPARGAYRDRHGRWARDAVDVDALLTNGADADGEVVWS